MIVAFAGPAAKNLWGASRGVWLAACIICWVIGFWPFTFIASMVALCTPNIGMKQETESGTEQNPKNLGFNRNLKRLRK